MESDETPSPLPVIARLDRLDRLIKLLEERRSLSRRDLSAVEGEKKCQSLSSALDEVQHKGTLMERLALLEKQVIELSMEVDDGTNTSRSSSSTAQGPETIGKNETGQLKEKDENGTIQAQEKASPSDEDMKEMTASHRSRKQRTKSHKKWPWLFRHTC